MMKERFAKLLLGEDMSGGGKGVCTALAISNAITNLSGPFTVSIPLFHAYEAINIILLFVALNFNLGFNGSDGVW